MVFRVMWALLALFVFIYVCKKIWFGWLKDFVAKESNEEVKKETSSEENFSENS